MIARNLRIAMALVAVVMLLVPGVTDAKKKRKILAYEGSLLAPDGKPAEGIFPLTFSLYRKSKGGKAIYSEPHYVAVADGTYLVELGQKKALPKNIDKKKLYIGISLTGGQEFFREEYTPPAEEQDPKEILAYNEPKGGAKGKSDDDKKAAAKDGSVPYAEKAGFAFEAETATNAKKLGGLGIKEIEDVVVEVVTKNIGAVKRYSNTAGTPGGTDFMALCPKGYAVIGIKGGVGTSINRIQLICSPIGPVPTSTTSPTPGKSKTKKGKQ